MKTLDLNLTELQISFLGDPVSNPDQLDIKGLNFGYVILLIGGKLYHIRFLPDRTMAKSC